MPQIMSFLSNWFKCLVPIQSLRRATVINHFSCRHVRSFADTPDVNSKQIMVQGSENEPRVRVRRARPADVPRVLRFVRENARTAWPGLAPPPPAQHLVLCDYVARALAQGHSMLAEQQEHRRGCSNIHGLALGVAVCAWDAAMLERWARCVRCAQARRLVAFTAHCLRAPALHDKYRVHNILQVILIVPKTNPKSTEIISLLTKNAIKRGKEVGFPLIRFDVACEKMAQTLEQLDLKKEWQLSYDVLPEGTNHEEIANKSKNPFLTDNEKETMDRLDETSYPSTYKHNITVYTAQVNQKDK